MDAVDEYIGYLASQSFTFIWAPSAFVAYVFSCDFMLGFHVHYGQVRIISGFEAASVPYPEHP